ncbi:MAG: hypothetical protein LBM27_02590 [Lactobacillaceae bacterium]|jgi:hypothetical protein|nr:hypothetical protein [Lactobacillaceae bacterium]
MEVHFNRNVYNLKYFKYQKIAFILVVVSIVLIAGFPIHYINYAGVSFLIITGAAYISLIRKHKLTKKSGYELLTYNPHKHHVSLNIGTSIPKTITFDARTLTMIEDSNQVTMIFAPLGYRKYITVNLNLELIEAGEFDEFKKMISWTDND